MKAKLGCIFFGITLLCQYRPLAVANVGATSGSTPVALREVAHLLGEIQEPLAVDENLLAAVFGHTVALMDPTLPAGAVLGTLEVSSRVRDLDLMGSWLFVTTDTQLLIVDVTTPSLPTILGGYALPGVPNSTAVTQQYAYLSLYSELHILDIGNPRQPRLLGTYSDIGELIAIAGKTLFSRNGSQLLALSLVNPAAPVLLDSYTYQPTSSSFISDAAWQDGRFTLLTVYAWGCGFLACGFDNHIATIDASNPASLTQLSDAPIMPSHTPTPLNGLAVAGDRAYIGLNGFTVIDMSDPTAPVIQGSLSIGAASMAAVGEKVYATGGTDLVLVNASNPHFPVISATFESASSVEGVALSGNYLATWSNQSRIWFQVWEISSLGAPQLILEYSSEDEVDDALIRGDLLYLVYTHSDSFYSREQGLRMVDLAAAGGPALLAEYLFPYDPSRRGASLDLDGNLAIVAWTADDNMGGLDLVDVSNPAQPLLAGSYAGTAVEDVAAGQSYTYALEAPTNFSRALRAYDLSDPAQIQPVGAPAQLSDGTMLYVDDAHAYVATPADLISFSLISPTLPIATAVHHNATGHRTAVTGDGEVLYSAVSDDYPIIESHVQLFDLSTPSHPVPQLSYRVTEPRGLAADGKWLAVADGRNGVRLLERFSPAATLFLPVVARP